MAVTKKNVLSGGFGAYKYLKISKPVINTMSANKESHTIFKLTHCDK